MADGGNFGTVYYTSYIDAYTDPSCSGNRYVAYDYYSNASSTIWIDMGVTRVWTCGSLSTGPDPAGAWAQSVNVWTGWPFPVNGCGFQADVSTTFWRTGYSADTTYTNL